MTIGIDLSSLENGAQHRGIGRYVTELLQEISKIDKRNNYVFFVTSKDSGLPSIKLDQGFKYRLAKKNSLSWKRKAKFIRTLIVSSEPLDITDYEIDVFFQIDIQQQIVSKNSATVSVLFDLIPFLFKETYQTFKIKKYTIPEFVFYYREKAKWRYAEKSLRRYAQSEAVVSISEHSKNDLLSMFPGIEASKIHVVPLAATAPPKIDTKKSDKLFSNLKKNKFLFYVGGADPRKGLVRLVADMEVVWKKFPNATLVIAGKEVIDHDIPEAVRLKLTVENSSHPENVRLLGYVSDADLAWLYKEATAFVFPSIYEGFGLPVLEAMQAGCPVVAYKNSSIPEVAGSAALLVKDRQSMAPAINLLLSDENTRKKFVKLGTVQASKFNWKKTAHATLSILESIGNNK